MHNCFAMSSRSTGGGSDPTSSPPRPFFRQCDGTPPGTPPLALLRPQARRTTEVNAKHIVELEQQLERQERALKAGREGGRPGTGGRAPALELQAANDKLLRIAEALAKERQLREAMQRMIESQACGWGRRGGGSGVGQGGSHRWGWCAGRGKFTMVLYYPQCFRSFPQFHNLRDFYQFFRIFFNFFPFRYFSA